MSHLFLMFCGLPGAGKTTIINELFDDLLGEDLKDFVVSTDDIVEYLGKKKGLTYNEAFEKNIIQAHKLAWLKAIGLFNSKCPVIIWDQTNVTQSKRKEILKNHERQLKDYKKICVYCRAPEETILRKRLNSRKEKTIPFNVIQNMKGRLQEPRVEEGFDQCVCLDRIGDIDKYGFDLSFDSLKDYINLNVNKEIIKYYKENV